MAQKIVSPRAELTVLRAICHKNPKIAGAVLGSVDDSYFDSPESVELLKAMKKHLTLTGKVPTYKLMIDDPEISTESRSFFRDSDTTVQSLEEAHKAVRILNRYRQVRSLYTMAAGIDREMQKGKIDIDALLESVSGQIASARTSKTTKDAFLHFGRNNSSLETVKDMLYGEENDDTIPTGIRPFDEQSGGLMRGSLVTIGASSGGGKSLMANQLAVNLATQGYKVVIVPLEMSKMEMTSRILANRSGIDVTKIMQRRLASGEKEKVYATYEKWVKKVKKRGGRLTIFKPEEDMDIEEVFAAVNSYDCDVVIIDYISLLKGADGDDGWQKLGAMARVAKINAESTHRVNVLLCQVNDEGKIRYARAISEHSTNSFIWVAKKEERERDVGRIRIEQPKARNSRSFPFEVGFEWAAMRIVDIDASEEVGDVATPMKNLAADV
jgi:replicative DNA helicase